MAFYTGAAVLTGEIYGHVSALPLAPADCVTVLGAFHIEHISEGRAARVLVSLACCKRYLPGPYAGMASAGPCNKQQAGNIDRRGDIRKGHSRSFTSRTAQVSCLTPFGLSCAEPCHGVSLCLLPQGTVWCHP